MIAVGFGCMRIDSLRAQVAGWAGVAFFGAALPVILLQAVRRGPMLVMDARGLDYRRLPIGVVPWEDVAEVWTGEVSGQRFLCVGLRDETPYLARLSAARRALAGTNRAMGFPLVTISFMGTDKTLEDALAAVREFLGGRSVPSAVSAGSTGNET